MAGGVNPFGFTAGVIPAPRSPRKPQDLPSAPFGFAPPPSKWEQTKEILEPYYMGPVNAWKGLMNADLNTLLYDKGPKARQAVEDSFNLAGSLAGGSSVVPKQPNSLNMGFRVFHGSPHDFPPVRLIEMADGTRLYQNMGELADTPQGARIIKEYPMGRFDLSKIGTGEGAQAYGHGLYFAEAEDVARGYRDRLTIDQTNSPIAAGKGYESDPDAQRILAEVKRLGLPANSIDALIKETGERAQRLAGAGFQNDAKTLGDLQYDLIEHADKFAPAGRMYEVEINADPDAFLDWDKPLSEQPEAVRRALQDYGIQTPETSFNWNGYAGSIGMPTAGGAVKHFAQFLDTGKGIKASVKGKDIGVFSSIEQARSAAEKVMSESGFSPQLLGSDIYAMMAGEYPGSLGARTRPEAASRLAEKGIPGIKYLDAGSRGAGDGTRNYVVFDDRLISIVRKYGIAGASALLGYNILNGMDPAQADELKRIEGNQ